MNEGVYLLAKGQGRYVFARLEMGVRKYWTVTTVTSLPSGPQDKDIFQINDPHPSKDQKDDGYNWSRAFPSSDRQWQWRAVCTTEEEHDVSKTIHECEGRDL